MANPGGATVRRGWFNASRDSSLRPRSARAVLGQARKLYALCFRAFKFPAIVGGVPPS